MDIEKKVKETIRKYDLIRKGDNVVVALSGGKDSTSILYILKKWGYNVSGLMIDLKLGDWSETHNKKMLAFCDKIGVDLKIVDLREELGRGICFIKDVLKKKKGLTGCSVCGTIKRWVLNKYAKKLDADKLVTGHNLDDEAQNVLMNFLKGNVLLGANSSPKTGNKSVKGFVQRVKPLFFVPENEIRKYAKKKNFDILYDKCPCAFGTYRVETREWMALLTDKEKMNVVNGFQKVLPSLKKDEQDIFYCSRCGEPARKNICKACEIFSEL